MAMGTDLFFRDGTAIEVGSVDIKKAGVIYSSVRRVRPLTKDHLGNYVREFLGLEVPNKAICDDHVSPMDYLWDSFSVDFVGGGRSNADAVVWANRAGGKTRLAAVATLLDCIFKPNC